MSDEQISFMKHGGGEIQAKMSWPAGSTLTCSGLNRTTYFVEYHDGTYIRANSNISLDDAERKAWERYLETSSCFFHEWEARGYTNGAGFCKHCNKFESGVFSLEEVGSICTVCQTPTNWNVFSANLQGVPGIVKACEQHSDEYEQKLYEKLSSLVDASQASIRQIEILTQMDIKRSFFNDED